MLKRNIKSLDVKYYSSSCGKKRKEITQGTA
jgi:hypothetical protein